MIRRLLQRRELVALLGGAAITSPLSASARQPLMRRVGYLNLRAKGSFGHPVLAAELVRDNVEVISAFGSPASARAAMRATSTIPIVGLSVAPLVKHYNRPEANVTASGSSPATSPRSGCRSSPTSSPAQRSGF